MAQKSKEILYLMLGTGTALSTIPCCARNAQLSIGQPVIAVARLPESSALGLQFAPFATFTGGAGNEEKKNKNKVQDQLDAAACIAAEEKREILKEGASYGSLFWLYIWFSLSLAPSPVQWQVRRGDCAPLCTGQYSNTR